MSRIPAELLERLSNSTGYDRTLLLDQVMRDYGVNESDVMLEIATHNTNGGPEQQQPNLEKEAVQAQPSISPRFIQDSASLRTKYDPSISGMQNQAQVSQAITCPACGVPLGIPEIRPIMVKCPSCLHEARYDN